MMESSMCRDQNFELNSERMMKVNSGLNFSLKFGFFSGLAMAYFAAIGFLGRVGAFMASNVMGQLWSAIYDNYHNDNMAFHTSGWLIVLPMALATPFLAMSANSFYKKLPNGILYVIYPLYFVIGVISFFGVFDDMKVWMGILLCIYGIIGFWAADITYRSLKELDYLVTQEGFPSFNLAMHYFGRSKYVKLREKWLEKNKKLDYYSAGEKPIENVQVTEAETPDGMSGVGAADEDAEKWFTMNKLITSEVKEERLSENEMDGIEIELPQLDDSEYYIEERRKPDL